MAIGCPQGIGGIHERAHLGIGNVQHALQHIGHLLLAGLAVAGNGHLDFQRSVFRYRDVTAQGSDNGYPLSTSQFQHRLYVFPEKRRFDGQFVRQIGSDDSPHPFVNMFQLEVGVGTAPKVDYPQGEHLRPGTGYLQHTVSHNIGTWVNAQNDFLFNRLYHLITSISVGNPITLSLKTFIISSFRRIPV